MSGSAPIKALFFLAISSLTLASWFMLRDQSGNTLKSPRIGVVWKDGKALLLHPDGAETETGGDERGGQGRQEHGNSTTLAVQGHVLEMVTKMREITDAKQVELNALRKATSGGGSSSNSNAVEAQGNVVIESTSPELISKTHANMLPTPLATEASTCAHQSLLHGATLEELATKYTQNGKYKWALVDAFASSGESVDVSLKGITLITFIITAHVYAGPPYNLPVGKAKPRRRNDYDRLMQEVGLKWTCKFGSNAKDQSPTYTSSPILVPKLDGDKHILVVHCKPPEGFDVATSWVGAGSSTSSTSSTHSISTSRDGRLTSPVGLEATVADGSTAIHFSDVHTCTAELVPPALERGACTMFGEMQPLNAAKAAASWTRFMLAAGFQFVALYLDPSDDGSTLERDVRTVLAPELSAGTVSLVRFHMAGRVAFETQTAQQMHCHWRFRGRAEWLAQLDIDEYLQPLGTFQTISDVLAKYKKKNAAALQVRNRYWDHHPVDETESFAPDRHDAWNMVWRDGRKSMHGREKLIYRPAMVDYMAVHRVTLGGKMAKPNAGTEIRHNHFSRHFKGSDEGVGCGGRESQGKHCQGAMQEVVKDLSFQEFYHRTMQQKVL